MSDLDNILNIIIPAAIFILIGIFIWMKVQKPLDKLFSGFGGNSEEEENSSGISYVPVGGGE